MADIHVLEAGPSAYRLVFHFDVPAGNNDVNVPWSAALVNSGQGGTTGMVEGTGAGQVSTAEKAEVEAGTRYEYPFSLPRRKMPDDLTAPQKLQHLRHFYAQEKADQIKRLQVALGYFGFTANEV